MAVKRSLTPLRLPRSFYPTKPPYKQQNVPARHFRPFYAGTFFNPQMRLPQKRRLLPHFYHKREIRKTRKTRKRSSHHFGHDGHSASEPPFSSTRKALIFKAFSIFFQKKTSGLSNAQAAAGMVEVTGFEPATFWSRSHPAQLHFMRYTQYIMHIICRQRI